MLIRDKIFERLAELNMTQKEFSERTGIPQSTVSDWRKKKTNPTAEKILVICRVLDVSPEWLLSGVEPQGKRGNKPDVYVVYSGTASGLLIERFNSMDSRTQERLLGYAEALSE